MAQACKALRFSLDASPVARAVASMKVGAYSLEEYMRAFAKNTLAPVWQQNARDGLVKGDAHSSQQFSFENSRAHATKLNGLSTA